MSLSLSVLEAEAGFAERGSFDLEGSVNETGAMILGGAPGSLVVCFLFFVIDAEGVDF